ncbi:hypothetical protein P9112_013511 [Eukaryota sp. TZLM1-RC]
MLANEWKNILDDLKNADTTTSLQVEEDLRNRLRSSADTITVNDVTTVINQNLHNHLVLSRLLRALLPTSFLHFNTAVTLFYRILPHKDHIVLQTIIDCFVFIAQRGRVSDVRSCGKILERCAEWLEVPTPYYVTNVAHFISAIGNNLPSLLSESQSLSLLDKLVSIYFKTNNETELNTLVIGIRVLLDHTPQSKHDFFYSELIKILACNPVPLNQFRRYRVLLALLLSIEFKYYKTLTHLPVIIDVLKSCLENLQNPIRREHLLPILNLLASVYSLSFSQNLLEPTIIWLKSKHPNHLLSSLVELVSNLVASLGSPALKPEHFDIIFSDIISKLQQIKTKKFNDATSHSSTLLDCFELLSLLSKVSPQDTVKLFLNESNPNPNPILFDCINLAVSLGNEHIKCVQSVVNNLGDLTLIQDSILKKAAQSLKNSRSNNQSNSDVFKTLKILSCFGTPSLPVFDFILNYIINFLSNQDCRIRFQASLAALHQLSYNLEHCQSVSGSENSLKIHNILIALISFAVSEPDNHIRLMILQQLNNTRIIEPWFVQDDLILVLVQALYDEDTEIRKEAICFVSKIAKISPSIAGSYLISLLEHLIFRYEFSDPFSTTLTNPNPKNVGDSIPALLGTFVKCAAPFIKQHVSMLIRVFINQFHSILSPESELNFNEIYPWLKDSKFNKITSSVPTVDMVETLCEIVLCADPIIWESNPNPKPNPNTKPSHGHHKSLLKIAVVIAMTAQRPDLKKSALRLITCVAQSSVLVIEPYFAFPNLLDFFETTLTSEPNKEARLECYRALGAMGAVDPYLIRHLDLHQSNSTESDVSVLLSFDNPPIPIEGATVTLEMLKQAVDGLEGDQYAIFTNNKDISITGFVMYHVLSLLLDSSNLSFFKQCFLSLTNIWRYHQGNSVHFLPWFFDPIFSALEIIPPNDTELLHLLLNCTINLVAVVKEHIRPYIGKLLELITKCWKVVLFAKISLLIETLSQFLADDLQFHFAPIIIKWISFFKEVSTSDPSPLYVDAVSHVLKTLAIIAHRQFELCCEIFSALALLYEPNSNVPILIKNQALETLGRFCSCLNISPFAIRIIHSLFRTISSPLTSNYTKDIALFTLACCAYRITELFIPYVSMAKLYISNLPASNNKAILTKTIKAILTNQLTSIDEVKTPQPELTSMGLALSDHNRPLPDFRNIENCISSKLLSESQNSYAWTVFCRTFLEGNPNGVLLGCIGLIHVCPRLVHELFQPAFATQWKHLDEKSRGRVVDFLKFFINSPSSSSFVLLSCLRLFEYMEFEEEIVNIPPELIKDLSIRLNVPTKALKFLESRFLTNPTLETAQELIFILTDLGKSEAVEGVIMYCKINQFDFVSLLEGSCLSLEMQGKFSKAVSEYTALIDELSPNINENSLVELKKLADLELGRLRCLQGLGDWDKLSDFATSLWDNSEVIRTPIDRAELASLALQAALSLDQTKNLKIYSEMIPTEHTQNLIWKSTVSLIHKDYPAVENLINTGRTQLDSALRTISTDSSDRMYPYFTLAQQFTEVEEVLQLLKRTNAEDFITSRPRNKEIPTVFFNKLDKSPQLISSFSPFGKQLSRLTQLWSNRVLGTRPDPDTWLSHLILHGTVLEPVDHYHLILKFVSLCVGRHKHLLAEKFLLKLENSCRKLEYLLNNELATDALSLSYLAHVQVVKDSTYFSKLKLLFAKGECEESLSQLEHFLSSRSTSLSFKLQSRALVKSSEWTHLVHGDKDLSYRNHAVETALQATSLDATWQHAWHVVGMLAGRAVKRYSDLRLLDTAVRAFLTSMACKGDDNTRHSLQDALRFLQVWFIVAEMEGDVSEYLRSVQTMVNSFLPIISSQVWLLVLPQLIARLSSTTTNETTRHQVNSVLSEILAYISRLHPEALIYPLTVASNTSESNAAINLLKQMEQEDKHKELVTQAKLVASSLIKLSVLRIEHWISALNHIAGLFHQQKFEEIHSYLRPLMVDLQKESNVPHEVMFNAAHKPDLVSGWRCYDSFMTSVWAGHVNQQLLNESMRYFDSVQQKLNERIKSYVFVELDYACPVLLTCKDLSLPIPGGYSPGKKSVTISSFHHRLSVFSSKQRPRKLTITGSDGNKYLYLLKGREDLRQDERVMQLYGLINSLMFQAKYGPAIEKSKNMSVRHDLSIERYNVIPLSPKSGLFGWVPKSDTLRQLYKSFRESHSGERTDDTEIITKLSNNQYAFLRHMHKRAIFEKVLNTTPDEVFAKLFWLKSRSAEAWVEHRALFTRSLAVISMVGYLLGLGDRHPSNMMVHRLSGKVFHIDHGDCFEAAMHREQFPETVPFRLTRMMVKALEITGIEGSFRITCENTLSLLRDNRDSLMAMLEAFVHDPLVTWKSHFNEKNEVGDVPAVAKVLPNQTAVNAVERVNAKLNGSDFDPEQQLDVRSQVELLFREAMSSDNLCELYIGWSATL